MSKRRIRIYDCTLREGGQAAGISFSLKDKLRISQLLDDMGFTYTEGGWPGSNAKDELYFSEIKRVKLKTIKIVGFGRTRLPNVRAEQDDSLNALVRTGMECGHIFGKGWDFHVRDVLRTSLSENLDAIGESVQFLKRHMGEVSFGFEHFFDAYKNNPGYSLEVLQVAIAAGADWIDLADTNGGCFPDEIRAIVSAVVSRFDIPFAVHCHNDTGCAVANTLTAVDSGVSIVEGTVNGYSERCGMADLCTIIPNLQLKLGYQCIPDDAMPRLTELSQSVSEILQADPLRWHPYVGSLAFTHKGGVHVDAFLKNPRTYEHIDPSLVGNKSNVVVSEVSGKANLNFFFKKHGLDRLFDLNDAKQLLSSVKLLELSGFDFDAAEEALLLHVLRQVGKLTPHFELKRGKMTFFNGPQPLILDSEQASSLPEQVWETERIELALAMTVHHPSSTTEEQVDIVVENTETSFSWLIRKLLDRCARHFPQLKAVQLLDYEVRAIDGSRGHPFRIRVILKFSDGTRTWNMLGLGRNVVSATVNATIDSFEYRLNMDSVNEILSSPKKVESA